MLFFVMRAMGGLLLSNTDYKSFSDFAGGILGPWAAFFTGWTYWFCWVLTGIADVVAISHYVAFFGFILWALTTQADTFSALIFTPIWFVALGIGYAILRSKPKHAELRALHGAKVAQERMLAASFNAGHVAQVAQLKEPAAT